MDNYRNDDDAVTNNADTPQPWETEPEITSEPPTATPVSEPVVAVAPVTTPNTPPQQLSASATTDLPATAAPSPGIIVLQWLTYAFWGWTLLALSTLIFVVIFHLMSKVDTGSTSLYAIAAIVVLLPISLICDYIYQKHEQQKKHGISMAVMVVHAVIFALFTIGTLIASLFAIVQFMVNTGSSDTANSYIALFVSLLIVAVLYSMTFLRTLNPFKSTIKIARIFDITMLVIVATFTVLAFIGPFAQTFQTKNDHLIESNLTYVQNDINAYVTKNNKLPQSLSDVSFESDTAKQLIDKKLVTYEQAAPNTATGDFRYQLCVTYTHKDTAMDYGYGSGNSYQSDGYSSYISTSGHKAGYVCYRLETMSYTGIGTGDYPQTSILN